MILTLRSLEVSGVRSRRGHEDGDGAGLLVGSRGRTVVLLGQVVSTQPHMRRGERAGVGLGGSEDTGLCTELTAEAPGEMGLSGPGRMSRAWGGDSRAPPCQAGAGVREPRGGVC